MLDSRTETSGTSKRLAYRRTMASSPNSARPGTLSRESQEMRMVCGRLSTTRPFRVLSLAGGGMRGVFTAAALEELEDSFCKRVGSPDARLIEQFDLVVGTSTGGLIALGLAFGKRPSELRDAYTRLGPKVFPKWWCNPRMLRLGPLICPVFNQARLRDVVKAMVPAGKLLGEASCPVVLTAMRSQTGEATCLKTPHHSSFYRDADMVATEAAIATSAAPIAFAHARTEKHDDLLDGGLWANTPVLVGIIEALKYFGQHLDNIRVLHIGTSRTQLPPRRWWHRGGLLEYGGLLSGRLQELLWSGQRGLAMGAAELILQNGCLVEIDHVFSGSGYSLMDASDKAMRALEQAGRIAARKKADDVYAGFCIGPASRTRWDWKPPSAPAK